MSSALRLFGLKAVVTDAGSGIGEAIARTLVKHGAKVLAVDAPSSAIETQFKSVRGITGFALDMSGADAAATLMSAVKSELGALDIVVNNFDWHTENPIEDTDDAELENLLQKIEARIASVVDAALPLMTRSPAGRIINMGCLRSVFGANASASFEKSRAIIATLTAKIAAESGKHGITANYIQPGAVMTARSRRVFSADKELRDFCIRNSAASRLGETVDVAKVALFLATDDSVFVSGTGIAVDGGAMLATPR